MKSFQVRYLLPKYISRYTIPVAKQGSWAFMEIYVAFVASISFFCNGLVQTYTSSAALYSLGTDGESNITLTRNDISWIASSPSLAAFFGTILSAPLLQFCGRQKTLVLLTVPCIAGWFMIGFTNNLALLNAGRAFTGLAMGLSKATAPIYVSECAGANIRGILGSLPPMMNGLGILIGLILGCWMDWRRLALILSAFPLVLLLLSHCLPESPFWLLLHNQGEKAFKALQRLRGGGGGKGRDLKIQEQLDEMRESVQEMNSSSDLSWRDCFGRKEIWIAFCLMIFQEFCGVAAIIYYLAMILREMGPSRVSNETAALSVGVVHFVAFFISLALIDRLGRKLLLIVSGVFMALAHSLLASFLYLLSDGNDLLGQSTESWLPIMALCTFIAAFSIGFGPVPYVFMTEVFPSKYRAYLCSGASLLSQLAAFIVLQTFPVLFHEMSSYWVFLMFGFVSLVAVVFVIFLVPETKGKTLLEIEKSFREPETLLVRDREGGFKDSFQNIYMPCVYLPITSPMSLTPAGSKVSRTCFPHLSMPYQGIS